VKCEKEEEREKRGRGGERDGMRKERKT